MEGLSNVLASRLPIRTADLHGFKMALLRDGRTARDSINYHIRNGRVAYAPLSYSGQGLSYHKPYCTGPIGFPGDGSGDDNGGGAPGIGGGTIPLIA